MVPDPRSAISRRESSLKDFLDTLTVTGTCDLDACRRKKFLIFESSCETFPYFSRRALKSFVVHCRTTSSWVTHSLLSSSSIRSFASSALWAASASLNLATRRQQPRSRICDSECDNFSRFWNTKSSSPSVSLSSLPPRNFNAATSPADSCSLLHVFEIASSWSRLQPRGSQYDPLPGVDHSPPQRSDFSAPASRQTLT